jgi:HPt (histidine-containing phosphotransfer) domain-containing protein
MIDVYRNATDCPSASVSGERPIDLVHLARMTRGDRSLEREVLQLFDRQATLLIARMRTSTPAGVSAAAHTLTGSARGIGAWQVARAAQAVEIAAEAVSEAELKAAVERLDAAAEATRTLIAELLRAH